MADQYTISAANLNYIERNLNAINGNIQALDKNIGNVNDNVRVVYDELGHLAQEFHDFINLQIKANRLGQAETRLVKIRQELETKYGHYDIIRRTTTGILQANDLGIVKRETISNATEELMISTPGYWLAPCLVALAAWINDQPELADRAVAEAIKRDDEKTSLFFTLICRRAERKQAALKWTQRYLENQDEENLNRNAVIVLDAYASGLLGADTEGIIAKHMNSWLERLGNKPGFVEQQTVQWSDAINLKRPTVDSESYTYLKKYSKTWPALNDVMQGAMLHAEILDYFINIFNQEASTDALKVQLDDILSSLVTDFDDEELPLRKEEKFEQLVVDFEGDESRARQNMQIEETAFETHKDFTQLLTDAAMKPETANASISTQKFAIALSKEWIMNAYNDVIAKNRMKVPHEIEINVDTFNSKTVDGTNESELVDDFSNLVESEKKAALEANKLTMFAQFCLYGGIVIAAIGLIMLTSNTFLGLIAIIAGVGLVLNHFSQKKRIEENRKRIEDEYGNKLTEGKKIIKAMLAEVVDFRVEFASKDAESNKVIDFLEQITPEQYVRKLSDTNRRIKVSDV